MAALDVLRGVYAAGGPQLRRFAGPLIAVVPTRYRLGSTYRNYRAHLERSKIDPEFVLDWQRNHLAQVLKRGARTPWYRATWPMAAVGEAQYEGRDPHMVLRDLPILTRQMVADHAVELVDGDVSDLDTVTTSGSSGQPATLYVPRARGAIEWAFRQDAWASVGYRDGDARGVLRGVKEDNSDVVNWDPALRELRVAATHMTAQYLDDFCAQLVRRRIRYLHGSPSAIAALASHVLATGHRAGDLITGILVISEPLYPSQRGVFAQAFQHAEISNFYGLSEKVLFGVEDKRNPGTFDLNPLYGIAELVDENDDRVTTPGKRGRVIGTGLLFQDMPLVRYDTGDTAELVENASSDNGFRLRLKELKPKKALDYLIGRDGNRILLKSFDTHLPALMLAQHIQFIQTTPGKVEIHLVPAQGVTVSQLRDVGREVETASGNQFDVEVKIVDEVKMNPRGKIAYVLQMCA